MTLSVNHFFAGALFFLSASTIMPVGSPMQSFRNLAVSQMRSTVVSLYVIRPGSPLVRPISLPLAASSHRLTGVFVDNAMDLIEKPAPTEAETLEQFETTMFDALRVGLTSIHDAATSLDRIAFFRRYVPLQFYFHF